jgi:hypothetical protein
VAVVRLVVDGRGDLTYGEVVAASGRVVARFRTWTELVPALQERVRLDSTEGDPEVGERRDRTPEDEDRP